MNLTDRFVSRMIGAEFNTGFDKFKIVPRFAGGFAVYKNDTGDWEEVNDVATGNPYFHTFRDALDYLDRELVK